MKGIIIQIIKDITAEKTAVKQVPNYALRIEILKRVHEQADKALNELSKSSNIKTGRTINDKFFEIVTN